MGVEDDFREEKILRQERAVWEPLWRDIGVYVQSKTVDFNLETLDTFTEGKPVNTQIFDTHAIKANRIAASGFKFDLWPNGKSVDLIPSAFIKNPESKAIVDYFKAVNTNIHELLSAPDNGLDLALDEYFDDQLALGNGGLGVFDDPDVPMRFEFWPIENCMIVNNKRSFVDKVFQLKRDTLYQLVQTYGLENLSKDLKEQYKEEKNWIRKYWTLIIIRRRNKRDVTKGGNKNMAFESIHYEHKTKKILKVSGFEEFPVKFGRLMKKSKESYGRGIGGDAMPEIKEASFGREALMLGIESTVEPPFIVENDSLLGNTIETGPKGMNVIDSDSRGSDNPIRPLFLVGDLRVGLENNAILHQSIDEHYFLDKGVDFKDKTRRTLGELQLSEEVAGRAKSSMYTRQIVEVFTPLLSMVVNKAMAKGFMGQVQGAASADDIAPIEIPAEIADLIAAGKPFYDLEYNTPAAKLLNSSQASALIETARFTAELGKVDPQAMIGFNAPQALRSFAKVKNVPEIIHTEDEVKKIKQQIAEQAQQQQQAENIKAQAAASKAQQTP